MKNITAFLLLLMGAHAIYSQHVPLLNDPMVEAFHSELSGESAKRNLEYIVRLHRMRGSSDFQKAVDFIAAKLKEYNLEEIETFYIPADGKSMYGTQKSRLAWDAEFAELWELEKQGDAWKPKTRLADWESMPITLAEDSESGEVTAELIDVGSGTSDQDYVNKDVRGKLVLVSSSPSAVVELAVGKYGAAGLISYTQNQMTAWWKEDANLIRWGHFDSFAKVQSFCFMISLKQAADFKQRLGAGQKVMLHAKVKAGKHPGNYQFVTAVIRGSDPALKAEEIAFTCHLDHQRPGANDNASGSMTILEIARTVSKLIADGRLARPARTLRFIWAPEIEGTSAILSQKPEYAKRIKADIHMDMVGGGPVTKSLFHVAGAPKSLPSFVADIGETWGRFLNEQTDAFANGYTSQYTYPFISEEGGKEALQAVLGQFHLGSDNEVYSEGSYKIPSIYMHDWPDRYIHTNFDVAANIDPTKLKRAGFIGIASGYVLANLKESDVASLWNVVRSQSLRRMSQAVAHGQNLSKEEADNIITQTLVFEKGVFASFKNWVPVSPAIQKEGDLFYAKLEESTGKPATAIKNPKTEIIYKRNPAIKGPLPVFAYDYLVDHLGKEKTAALRLINFGGLWGDYYPYEALNFVDGKRTVTDIRNAISAEFGPIPAEYVDEYLKALESVQVVTR